MRIFALAFACFVTLSAHAESEIVLSPPAGAALKKWNPKFEVFKKTDYSPTVQKLFPGGSPAILTEDLNGDKKPDFVVLGELDKSSQAAVAVLSSKTDEFTAVVVEEWEQVEVRNSDIPVAPKSEKGVPMYLSTATGSVAEKFKRVNKHSAFQIQGYNGAIRQFAIRHGKPLRLVPE